MGIQVLGIPGVKCDLQYLFLGQFLGSDHGANQSNHGKTKDHSCQRLLSDLNPFVAAGIIGSDREPIMRTKMISHRKPSQFAVDGCGLSCTKLFWRCSFRSYLESKNALAYTR